MLNTPHIDLSRVDLFKGLDDAALEWVQARLTSKTFATHSMILTQGQPGEVVYLIVSGTVKVFSTARDGAEVIISVLGAGDTVGEMSMIDSTGRSASAITLETSEILWMNRSDFQEALERFPRVSRNLNMIMSWRLRFSTDLIQSLATLDVNGRVARQILAFAQKYGQPDAGGHTLIPIRLNQSEIADLVGASRKRVNQVMVHFKRQNLIAVDADHRITVLDAENLKQYC